MNATKSEECYVIKVSIEIAKVFKSVLKPVSEAVRGPQEAIRKELILEANIFGKTEFLNPFLHTILVLYLSLICFYINMLKNCSLPIKILQF